MTNEIAEAIKFALISGAKLVARDPFMSFPHWLHTADRSVEIPAPALNQYFDRLKDLSSFKRLSELMLRMPDSSGSAISPLSVALLLAARAKTEGDVDGVVRRFLSFLRSGEAKFLVIMAVAGPATDRTVELTEGIQLQTIESLPPSFQKEQLLFQRGPMMTNASCAIVKEISSNNVLVEYSPGAAPPPLRAPDQEYLIAMEEIEEVRLCLGLAGIAPSMTMLWVQPADPVTNIGSGSAWQYPARLSQNVAGTFNLGEGLEVCRQYFSMPAETRTALLKIPLDRYIRSKQGGTLTDICIDLGIALEALLLHEIEGDHGELNHRLSLRGAWLLAKNLEDRLTIFSQLKKGYGLRSKAVHRGLVKESEQNRQIVEDARTLCEKILRRFLEIGHAPDWGNLVLGG